MGTCTWLGFLLSCNTLNNYNLLTTGWMNYLISNYLFKHLSPVYNRFNSITCFQHSYTECLRKEKIILGSWIQKWEWGGGGGALMFGGSHCCNFLVTKFSLTVQCPLSFLHMCFYWAPIPKGDLTLLGKSMIDENLHYKVQFARYVSMRPS